MARERKGRGRGERNCWNKVLCRDVTESREKSKFLSEKPYSCRYESRENRMCVVEADF